MCEGSVYERLWLEDLKSDGFGWESIRSDCFGSECLSFKDCWLDSDGCTAEAICSDRL